MGRRGDDFLTTNKDMDKLRCLIDMGFDAAKNIIAYFTKISILYMDDL